MKIVFGAVISPYPFSAGMAWNWMHHVIGLKKLGHEVIFVEEIQPDWCVDHAGNSCSFEQSVNQELFVETMQRFGMMEHACQLYHHGESSRGLSVSALAAHCKEADLLINISGHVTSQVILENVRRKAYVDQDPVYTQLWFAEYGKDLNFEAHDVFLTVGLNIGTSDSAIPDCGINWHHVIPPVILEFWPFEIDTSCPRFTTVGSWSGYGDLCYRGEWYRSKYQEFQRFASLPTKVSQEIEVILKSFRDDDEGIKLLKSNQWNLSHGSGASDLAGYQTFISASRAELGIAKNAYVKGRSGWFSDRTAHYLASGKPVLAQSTGFERHLPVGRGLLTFETLDDAAAGIEAINSDYEGHCIAAREFAEEHLNYDKVLPRFLEHCLS